jgi:2-amino-4-hydroxy-6-hydroxymethyldihydropteridine diphosphokinase
MFKVFIALGSNLGNPAFQLERAVQAFNTHPEIHQLVVSTWLESEPMNCPEGSPAFLNGVMRFETTLTPEALFAFCQSLEAQAGRKAQAERVLNEARPLDLDILFYGDFILHTPYLEIPHPRLHQRAFVLKPLVELDATWVHPVLRRSMLQLLEDLHKIS